MLGEFRRAGTPFYPIIIVILPFYVTYTQYSNGYREALGAFGVRIN